MTFSFSRRQFIGSASGGLLGTPALFQSFVRRVKRQLDLDPSLERRKAYLRILNTLLDPTKVDAVVPLNGAHDFSWEAWQLRTGELPPDFQTMPSRPHLPDPLVMLDDAHPVRIRTRQQWEQQRKLIRAGFERWIHGHLPPAPGNLRGVVLSSATEGDATVHRIRLEFGPDHGATLNIQLVIPPGRGPFPVLVTNHQRGRPWANTAIRRGYAACSYQALDRGYGVADDSEAWHAIYPQYDFGAVARWAWGGMRAVDYLMTRPEINKQMIAIGGHSRNSKQAMLAAAWDTRIGAVAASRGNTGDSIPWRFTEDVYQQEAIEELTGGYPFWFHPRLRFFVGREHKLPVEQNLLLSMIAPRGLLLSEAFTEHQANPLGVELDYRSVKQVYRFLGAEQNVGLYQQPGEHPSSAEDVEQYFDFFDSVFGRHKYPVPENFVHGYEFASWKRRSGEHHDPLRFPVRSTEMAAKDVATPIAWNAARRDLLDRLRWMMGDEPPAIPYYRGPGSGAQMTSEGWRGDLFFRPGDGYDAEQFPYGDDLVGYLYRPPAPPAAQGPLDPVTGKAPPPPPPAKWPVVIWLHPYSYAMGFSRYVYWGPLYQRGFAVLTFDQIGFGSRNQYPLRFYDRHPHWSLLGKMIADTRAVIDFVLDSPARFDTSRIYLQGYGLGAKVALITAALDARVTGVSAMAGFAPLRAQATRTETEGLRHYSHIHGLMPRLGYFLGHEERVPADYNEIIAAIAPRPVQIVAPTLDRHAPVDAVRSAVDDARRVFALHDKSDALALETPEDFNRFPGTSWMTQIDWVTRQAGLRVPPPRTK